ncbi:taste receptor type 1 member 1 [Polypterus senegalus]|uniref:taste receptor type 1 member 1 n=1 Tax=Polypterus senegalus TaxID=55291 RepID=UPI00196614D0|nr:taste receptor type 1 member 1 [Polypterus senegalus]
MPGLQLLAIRVWISTFTALFVQNVCTKSEFKLEGDYILGGVFPVHYISQPDPEHFMPEVPQCQRYDVSAQGYQQLQMMRFAVEDVNNQSWLLPNITLGYNIFDSCHIFVDIISVLNFLAMNTSHFINVSHRIEDYKPQVLAVIGPYTSTEAFAMAPLLSSSFIPMVSHGASSIRLSDKKQFPSFLRMIPSDQYQARGITLLLHKFKWKWIALIGSNDDYSQDGLEAIQKETAAFNICVAYQETIPRKTTEIHELFRNITMLKVSVVVVFASEDFAVPFIKEAIAKNIRDKVWIASEAWSMNPLLLAEPGISSIGTILGMANKVISLPGFSDFVQRLNTGMKEQQPDPTTHPSLADEYCNQDCLNCCRTMASAILQENPTYSSYIYLAVYAVAHALHAVLGCNATHCERIVPVMPYELLQELKKVHFSVNDYKLEFDSKGDPPPLYDIINWDFRSQPFKFTIVGSYSSDPKPVFLIHDHLIQWHDNGTIPTSVCSSECQSGYRRLLKGIHDCCFNCELCPKGTYINITADPQRCQQCGPEEWSEKGSTSCLRRTLEFLDYSENVSIGLLFLTAVIFACLLAVIAIFAAHHNTPVVKSAGGPLCYFMLVCMATCCFSIVSFFGKPNQVKCIMRNLVFSILYTSCIACLTVRSFQIICVFKMAAKLPRVYSFWVKSKSQCFFVMTCVCIQISLCTLWVGIEGPSPYNNTVSFKNQIIFSCHMGNISIFTAVLIFIGFLGSLCFVFSYMGIGLPKNYNEAKCITFSLLISFFSWISYFTAYMIYYEKYISAFNVLSVLVSLLGILIGYFIPKCYIILIKPEHNTTAHFQSCIQTYTMKSTVTSTS